MTSLLYFLRDFECINNLKQKLMKTIKSNENLATLYILKKYSITVAGFLNKYVHYEHLIPIENNFSNYDYLINYKA